MSAVVEADKVCVYFPLYHGHARSLKRVVFSTVAGRVASVTRSPW